MNKNLYNRSGNIEFLRFIFCLGILFFHLSVFFPEIPFYGGYLGVDFFFMISGAFLAKKVRYKQNDSHESISVTLSESRKYLWKRIAAILPYYVVSVIIAFLISSFAAGKMVIFPLYLVNDFTFLMEFGFTASGVTGASWFLSAMFIAIFILYPIIRRFYAVYTKYISCFVALSIYGLLVLNYQSFNYYDHYIFGFININVLRALAGFSLGVFSFEIANLLKRKRLSKFTKVLLTSFLYGFVLLELYLMHFDNGLLDQIELIIIFFIVVILLSGQSLTLRYYNNFFVFFLGKMSMVLFINHYYWISCADVFIKYLNLDSVLSEYYHKVLFIVLMSFLTSLFVYYFVKAYRYLWNKIKPNLYKVLYEK